MSKKNRGSDKKEGGLQDPGDSVVLKSSSEVEAAKKSLWIVSVSLAAVLLLYGFYHLATTDIHRGDPSTKPTAEEIVQDAGDFEALEATSVTVRGVVDLDKHYGMSLDQFNKVIEEQVLLEEKLAKKNTCPEGKLTLSLPDGTFLGCLN